MNRFAARQSIVDRDNNILAYELLFRDSLINVFPNIDANTATVKLIENTIESKQRYQFTNRKPAFINFTLETLKNGYPLQFNKETVVVEILESEEPSRELLDVCINLYKKGYEIALDDFIHHQQWHDFFPYVKIIKIDFRQTSTNEILELKEHLGEYPHIELLAEKIETEQEYKQARTLGFKFFQGFFFDKPEVIRSSNDFIQNINLSMKVCAVS